MGREVLCKQLFCGTCCPCAICIVKTSAKTAHGEGVLSAGETDAHCNRKLSRRGESRGGCRSDLDIRQPPLGVLWLLSVATESNRIASAEATEAAKKVKSAIEVTQDTSPNSIPYSVSNRRKAPQPLAFAAQVSYNEEDARNTSIFAAFGKMAKELLPL